MIDISCMIEATGPLTTFSCLDIMAGGYLWNVAYIGLLLLFVIGWSTNYQIAKGMMIGGLFAVMIGLPMFTLEWISILTFMIGVVVMLAGIFFTWFNTEKDY